MASSDELQSLKSKRTAALSAVTRKRNELNSCMTKEDMLHLVKTHYDEYNELVNHYQITHNCYISSVSTTELPDLDEKIDSEEKKYEERLNIIVQFKTSVMNWISQSENSLSDKCSIQSGGSDRRSDRSNTSRYSHDSRRSKSSRHSQRSTFSIRSEEKVQIAVLLAEKNLLQQKQDLQLQQKKLDQDQEHLRLDLEIAKAQARERVWCEEETVAQLSGTKASGTQLCVENVSNEGNVYVPVLTNADVHVKPKEYLNVVKSIATPSSIVCDTVPCKEPLGDVEPKHKVYCDRKTAPKTKPISVMQKSTDIQNVVLSNMSNMSQNEPIDVKKHPDVGPTRVEVVCQPQSTGTPSFPTQLPLHLSGTTSLDPTAVPFQPSSIPPEISAFCQLINALSLPQPKVPAFGGNPVEYQSFVMAFDARIASRISNPYDKLYYLQQHLTGEAKELTDGCIHMGTEAGYAEARSILARQYGDPYKVSMAYVSKIMSWPIIKNDDSTGLQRFSSFLTNCGSAMLGLNEMSVLNHAPNMQAVVLKLPSFLQNKWRSQAAQLRKRVEGLPNFHHLVRFIQDETEAATDSIYSKEALAKSNGIGHKQTETHYQPPKHKSASFATQLFNAKELSKTNALLNNNSVIMENCLFCSGKHDVDECKDFTATPVEERRLFIKNKELCFGCYGKNHVSKDCSNKRTCGICEKRHPTALHMDNFVFNRIEKGNDSDLRATHMPEGSISTGCVNTINDNVMFQAILPVFVKQRGTNTKILTYAFFDNGSTGCFITEELRDELGATGTETHLQVRTMNGVTCKKTTAVEGLVLSDISNQNEISLPRLFTENDIPVQMDQIPQPEVVEKFLHLHPIAHHIQPVMNGLSIGILIGSNCPTALEPMDVIASQQGSPYAVKLRHGWTINGPISMNDSSTNCNRITIQEIQSTKEMLSPTTIANRFERDFSAFRKATLPDERSPSIEDRMFVRNPADGASRMSSDDIKTLTTKERDCKRGRVSKHSTISRLDPYISAGPLRVLTPNHLLTRKHKGHRAISTRIPARGPVLKLRTSSLSKPTHLLKPLGRFSTSTIRFCREARISKHRAPSCEDR